MKPDCVTSPTGKGRSGSGPGQWECVYGEKYCGLCAVMMAARTGLNSSSVITPWERNDWSTTRCTWLYASSSGTSRTSGVSSRDILAVLLAGEVCGVEVGSYALRGDFWQARPHVNTCKNGIYI